jgi:hypothetical protein
VRSSREGKAVRVATRQGLRFIGVVIAWLWWVGLTAGLWVLGPPERVGVAVFAFGVAAGFLLWEALGNAMREP